MIKSIEASPHFKVFVVDHKGKWKSWCVDERTLELISGVDDDYNYRYSYGTDQMDYKIWAHNQAMPLEMYKLFIVGYATFLKKPYFL
ncbi:hypothetical protein ACFOPX_06700 [Helicobacter baculiformis]|uniref:Uncharacterized protein n=1 Tax=Helicobacter baculiformis TaxID=427351 RepID=A0ABV7ZKG2_9HELI|nr:hypothetical protein [Helicobacter baculiformis]